MQPRRYAVLRNDEATDPNSVRAAIAELLNFHIRRGRLCPRPQGRISLVRALLYWVAQLLGAVLASLLLRLTTNGMGPVGFAVASGEGNLHAVLLEIVMTFGLVYTVYATSIDHRRASLGPVAPLAIRLILAANILVGGPYDGASMNPARAFGRALVRWRWKNHWMGPSVGAALARVVYEFIVMPPARNALVSSLLLLRNPDY